MYPNLLPIPPLLVIYRESLIHTKHIEADGMP
jgi:hypothetical protein